MSAPLKMVPGFDSNFLALIIILFRQIFRRNLAKTMPIISVTKYKPSNYFIQYPLRFLDGVNAMKYQIQASKNQQQSASMIHFTAKYIRQNAQILQRMFEIRKIQITEHLGFSRSQTSTVK